MESKYIEIGDREYKVLVAQTESDKMVGLSATKILPDDEGMLFDYSDNQQQELVFTMKDTSIPLDIIFINDKDEVCAVDSVLPFTKDDIVCTCDEDELLKYVLEVNINSGIKVGDSFEIEDDISDEEVTKMYVLGPDGSPVMELEGGERIVSRRETRQLITKARKADKTKEDKDYKVLGKLMFKILKGQNERPEEYVDGPK